MRSDHRKTYNFQEEEEEAQKPKGGGGKINAGIGGLK